MKTFIILITISLVAVMVSSSPIDRHHKEAGTPPADHHALQQPTKGGRPVYKGYPTQELYLNVKKGEYVCGNRICKLRPGEVPKGCNGMCQYPIA